MPEFMYRALDAAGARMGGTMSAASRATAMNDLAAQGLFVTRIAETKGEEDRAGGKWRLPFVSAVPQSEMVLLIRRLATLVGSGIPLVESLKAIAGQIESPVLRHAMGDVKEDVQQGQGLSHALSKHPRIFSQMTISMVRVGETGGILPLVLEQLADFTERDREIRGEVKTALAYPCLVLALAAAVVVFLMTAIVPKLEALFSGMRASLPVPTVMLLAMSSFAQRHGWLCLLALLAGGVGTTYWLRTERGAAAYDRARLRIPVLGNLIRRTAIGRFSRSLGALVRGGVPLMEALDVVKHIMSSNTMTQAIDRMQACVRRGDSMARGLENEALFPDMVRFMISSGEESGHLDDMLFRIADVYEMETRNAVRVAINLLAPLMILMVAAVVGFIAVAMLLPIFQINTLL
ncbi:MAG TPA: type II secretion system F family protein [Sumerlaeia bacterium]|nr:type II secretion system F family protein [Sumerlaeia bacterium]